MRTIADLHLHSRFSRAVSRDLTIQSLAAWGAKKGIGLLATGDWTHPAWMAEIREELEETGTGLLRPKGKKPDDRNPLFLLSTELSCIYQESGRTHRVHILVWVPSIASAIGITDALTARGCNVRSDGRPILGLSVREIAELVFSVDESALIVPAHIWTPWFSVFGSRGGYPTLAEAFGPYAPRILAVESGLSSSPDMNWTIGELDTRSIVSFSDAHSGAKLGREATVFEFPDGPSFAALRSALDVRSSVLGHGNAEYGVPKTEDQRPKILYTIEFHPEEGKYHLSGHRACGVRLTPEETRIRGSVCSVCGKPLTQGVLERVGELATRPVSTLHLHTETAETGAYPGVAVVSSSVMGRPPFVMLVPLMEILSEAIGSPATGAKVRAVYERMVSSYGSEFAVLMSTPIDRIVVEFPPAIAQGIEKARRGDLIIDPGYDGVFGVVRIWPDEDTHEIVESKGEQLAIFTP